VNLADIIAESTKEIFSSMVMMEVTEGAPKANIVTRLTNSISGTVGLGGSYKGMIAIHIPEPVALAITTNFLGLEVESIDDDVQDAVGELANMLAGNVKAALSEGGSDIKLSLPSTVFGDEYTFQCMDDGDIVIMPFNCEQGEFLVDLRLRAEN